MPDLTTTAKGEATPGTPHQGATRINSLDLIRGAAILGILPVNMTFFSGPALEPGPMADTWQARWVDSLVLLLFQGKMVTLLAVLFGAGLALQANRAQAAGQRFAPYGRRRMLALFFIGLAHALLLSHLDILTSYAVAGFIALALVRVSDRFLRRVTIGLLIWCYGTLLVVALFLPLSTSTNTQDLSPQPAEEAVAEQTEELSPDEQRVVSAIENLFTRENEIRVFRHGNFAQLIWHRAVYLGAAAIVFILVSGWYVVMCILLGVWLIRGRVFQQPELHRSDLRKWIRFGLCWGLLFHAAAIPAYHSNRDGLLYMCLLGFGALPLAVAYLGILALWAERQRLPRLQDCLRAVGRLALSNYLLQSIICGFIFCGYGLGLYGRLDPLMTLGIVIALWALQLFLSPLWLNHFAIGPAEWLWRWIARRRA